MSKKSPFESSLYAVPPRLRRILEFLPEQIKGQVQEIRIRNNLPLALTVGGGSVFVLSSGQTSKNPENAVICSVADTQECLRLLTKQSVFAHTDEIKYGFIRMDNGGRAGICGVFAESGMISEISGINIRIARQVMGCADGIFESIKGSVLILGPPASGKTTLLRDLIRRFSHGGKRVSVIDSRGEISACSYGVCCYDLGVNTDVYLIENKATGIEMALRTLYPNIIAFDEIGSFAELNAVKESFNAGVDIITTAHIGCFEDIARRELVKKLILLSAVKTVVLMPPIIGEKIKIYDEKELECLF